MQLYSYSLSIYSKSMSNICGNYDIYKYMVIVESNDNNNNTRSGVE